MVYKVYRKASAGAQTRETTLRRCSWLRVASFNYILDFCTAAPTARHLLQSFSQGYLTAGTKEWPAAPTSKSSASPTPRRTLNATAGRVRAWRAGGARRCRASRTRRTGIRTRQCPRRRAIVATHASQVLDQPVRGSRAEPQVCPRAGRGLCAVQGLCGAAAPAGPALGQVRTRFARGRLALHAKHVGPGRRLL